jgi:ornithine decarboxylase
MSARSSATSTLGTGRLLPRRSCSGSAASAASISPWSIWVVGFRPIKTVPSLKTYGSTIFKALRKHFGNRIPENIIEPGRGMVGNAGVIEAEVVLVSKKSAEDDLRWVYLDIGKFGGLAETMDESIRYPIRTPRDGEAMAPCVLAGPTCDSADVLYAKEPYMLPISLEIGDRVLIEGTGA